jgi:hypothetical protein
LDQTIYFFHKKQHPKDRGSYEIEDLLNHLAVSGIHSLPSSKRAAVPLQTGP